MTAVAEPRYRKRISCQLWAGNSSYSGVVLNLSRQGLFVQTCAGLKAGDPINLKLRDEIQVHAHVVWRKCVPVELHNYVEGGLGLRILGAAPEGYYQLLAEAAGVQA